MPSVGATEISKSMALISPSMRIKQKFGMVADEFVTTSFSLPLCIPSFLSLFSIYPLLYVIFYSVALNLSLVLKKKKKKAPFL